MTEKVESKNKDANWLNECILGSDEAEWLQTQGQLAGRVGVHMNTIVQELTLQWGWEMSC